MKAMTTLRCGGGLRIKKKARGFMCGCGGSKAISISDGSDKQSPVATPPANNMSSTTTTTTTMSTTTATRSAGNKTASSAAAGQSSFSPSSYYADDTDVDADADTSVGSTPSVAALLRQLSELERSVRSLQGAVAEGSGAKDGGGGRRHRRTVSDGGGGGSGRVEESVAVVKESADPLTDFRRSMLQMIVEKEIVGGAELRELLHRFLSLNSPHHHHVILRAFAEIWEEVFAGYEPTPDFLVSHRKKKKKLPSYAAAAPATDDMWTIRN
ncbi:hypothetical protein ABZP36_012857 [Zizania latifolia]